LGSQFKKDDMKRKKEVKMYFGDGCEDPDDFKLDILGW